MVGREPRPVVLEVPVDKPNYSHRGTGSCVRPDGNLKLKGRARSDEEFNAGNSFTDQDMLDEGLNQREPFKDDSGMYELYGMMPYDY